MSLWDDFKNAVTPFIQTLTGQGSVNGVAPVNQRIGDNTLGLRPGTALSTAANPVSTTYQNVYSYAFARPVTTMLLGENIDPGAQYPGKGGAGWNDIRARWNASEYVSPGQEIVAGFNNYFGDGSDSIFNQDPNSKNSPRYQVNQAMLKREKLNRFKDNWWANTVSGTSDAIFNWYLDPGVVATKGLTTAKVATRAETIAAERASIFQREGGTWEFIKWATKEKDANLINERLKNTNPTLAHALADSTDERMSTLIWLGSRGDQASIEAIRTEQASLASAVESNQNILGFAKLNGYSEGMTRMIRAELADLELRDDKLGQAMSTQYTNIIVSGTKKEVAPLTTTGSAGAVGQDLSIVFPNKGKTELRNIARAEKKFAAKVGYGNQYTKKVFQRAPGIRPVVVWTPNSNFGKLRQLGASVEMGTPTGIFHLQGHNASDGATELLANLRSSSGPLKKLFNGEEVSIYHNRYLTAPNSTERSVILKEIEDEAMARIFDKYGLSRDVIPDIVNHIGTKKNEVVEQVVKRDGGKFPGDEGEINVLKVFDTKTIDTYVMHNWQAFDRAVRNNLAGKEMSTKNTKEKLIGAYDWTMQIWRPAVLFRLGYTIRNIGEGALRVASVSDAMMGAQYNGAGGRFVKNRGIGWTAQKFGKDIDQVTSDALTELDGTIAARLKLRGIDPREFYNGTHTIPADMSLTGVIDEQDKLLASRQSVIENFIAEGKYRLGAEKETYLGITYDGAFAGNGGRFLRELSSARGTKEAELVGPQGVVRGIAGNTKWSDTSTVIRKSDASYVPSLVNVINNQWRNSPLATRILRGDSEEAVTAWLKSNDREAYYVRNEIGLSKYDAELAVSRAVEVINRYMPDPTLRAAATVREVRAEEVGQSIKAFERLDKDAYGDIVAKELEEVVPKSNVKTFAKGFVSRTFHYIGSLPEDTILRHPFVAMRYNQYTQQAIKGMVDNGIESIDNATLNQIQRAARAYSLREVKRTLYTIERYSNSAEVLRFVAPFYAAFENTARTWARIVRNDPSIGVHALQVLNAPTQAGMVIDQEGRPIKYERGMLPSKNWSIQFQVPENVAKHIPGLEQNPNLRINLKSLNVVLQGETYFTPGAGPHVQMLVSEMNKKFDNNFVRLLGDMTLTNGVSKRFGSYDMALPAGARRLVSKMRNDEAVDFARDQAMIALQLRAEYEKKGQRVPDNLLDIANEKTSALYTMRMFVSVIAPAQPQFTIKPEYQQYVDIYRQFQGQGTVDGKSPNQRFTEQFPEFFQWTASTSENKTGVYASRTARQNIGRYKNLFGSVLSVDGADDGLIGLLVNNPEDTKYDQYTAAWMSGRQVASGVDLSFKSTRDVMTTIKQPYINKGWDEYIAMTNETQARLNYLGLTSYNQRGAEEILQYRQEMITFFKNTYPEWYADFKTSDKARQEANAKGLEIVLKDPVFAKDKANDPLWVGISGYLEARKEIADELARNKAAGGSGSITAKSNDYIQQHYISTVNWFNSKSPRSAEVFSRFFDGEFGRFDELNSEQTMGGY